MNFTNCTKDQEFAPTEEERGFSNFLSENLIWETQIYEINVDTFGYQVGRSFLFDDKFVFSKGYFATFPRGDFVAIDVGNDQTILWDVQPRPSFYAMERRDIQDFAHNNIQPEAADFNIINTNSGTWENYSSKNLIFFCTFHFSPLKSHPYPKCQSDTNKHHFVITNSSKISNYVHIVMPYPLAYGLIIYDCTIN